MVFRIANNKTIVLSLSPFKSIGLFLKGASPAAIAGKRGKDVISVVTVVPDTMVVMMLMLMMTVMTVPVLMLLRGALFLHHVESAATFRWPFHAAGRRRS